jgi:hypothetical protein
MRGMIQVGGESIEHADAPHSLGLPGARRERPRGSRAAKQRDELAAPCRTRKKHTEGRRGSIHDIAPVATGSPQAPRILIRE